MKSCNEDEVLYFKEILTDHIRENFPMVILSESEIFSRATQAAYELSRDDLTTSQVIESAFSILLKDCNRTRSDVS